MQSAIDGFNVCVFAYGQTGSGKTYTIQGPKGNAGVAPRAIVELFDLVGEMSHCQVKIETYMVELYLDQLNDLLHEPNTPSPKLEIKEDPNGMMYIQGVTVSEHSDIRDGRCTASSKPRRCLTTASTVGKLPPPR